MAGQFATMLVVVILFQPTWNLESVANKEPGLELRPLPDTTSPQNSIKFEHGVNKNNSWQPWVERLQQYLDPYEPSNQHGSNVIMCDRNLSPPEGAVCHFDIDSLGPNCTKEKFFGYEAGSPCVLVKLNQVLNWIPEAYNNTDLPTDLPSDLQDIILKSHPDNKMVWLSCEGENTVDRQNIGPIVYTPIAGFAAQYFPYKNSDHYLSPVVMLQFLNPTRGVQIKIACNAWARNIATNGTEKNGGVRFELMVE